jgi:hypothetical protein
MMSILNFEAKKKQFLPSLLGFDLQARRFLPFRGGAGRFPRSSLSKNPQLKMIEDRGALDQHLAAVEHRRRHPPQRIIRCDLLAD